MKSKIDQLLKREGVREGHIELMCSGMDDSAREFYQCDMYPEKPEGIETTHVIDATYVEKLEAIVRKQNEVIEATEDVISPPIQTIHDIDERREKLDEIQRNYLTTRIELNIAIDAALEG